MTAHVIYLHGFASSPGSTKAAMFREALARLDVNVVVPDLNVPTFETLTLTAMLHRTAETVRALPPGPVYLIGSSFGGLTAVHFMDRYREQEASRVHKLLLLVPAFDFMENRQRDLGAAGLARWREQGWLPVPHYAHDGQPLRLHYGLVEDVTGYDSFNVRVDAPTLIFHGLHDESVDYRQSQRYATGRPNVELRLPESDHSLMDQMPVIIPALIAFCDLQPR